MTVRRWFLLGPIIVALASVNASAQQLGVVAVDESPTATQLLGQVSEFVGSNPDEAARLVRRLLGEFRTRLVPSATDADLFVPVELRVAELLRQQPGLRQRLRQDAQDGARQLLIERGPEAAWRSAADTTAGLEAGLRLTAEDVLQARFAVAAERLGALADHPDLTGAARVEWLRLRGCAAWGLGDTTTLNAAQRSLSELGDAQTQADLLLRMARATPPSQDSCQDPLGEGHFGVGLAPDARVVWEEPMLPAVGNSLPGEELGPIGLGEEMASWGAALVALPSVTRTLVLVADGSMVAAHDRIVPQEDWRLQAMPMTMQRIGTEAGDLLGVTTIGERALALTGIAQINGRTGGRLMVCLSVTDGQRLWAVTPPAEANTDDGEYSFHGVPIVSDGVVAVLGWKVSARSETSSVMFGFSLEDGRALWQTPLGSCAATRQATVRPITTPLLHGSDALVTTPSGTTARVAIRDGGLRWLRRGLAPVHDARYHAMPWETGRPALCRGRLFTMGADGESVLVIDPQTGALLLKLPTGPGTSFGAARYLLANEASGTIAAIGGDLCVVDAQSPDTPLWILSSLTAATEAEPDAADRHWLRGRVQSGAFADGTGGLVIPSEAAVEIRNPRSGALLASVQRAGPKNPCLSDGALFLAERAALVAISSPDATEAVLLRRLDAGGDAAAAVALARFALSSGKPALALSRLEQLVTAAAAGGRDADLSELLTALLDLAGQESSSSKRFRVLEWAQRLAVSPVLKSQLAIARGDILLASDPAAAFVSWESVLADELVARVPTPNNDVVMRTDLAALVRMREAGAVVQSQMARRESEASTAVAAMAGESDVRAWERTADLWSDTVAGSRAHVEAAALLLAQGDVDRAMDRAVRALWRDDAGGRDIALLVADLADRAGRQELAVRARRGATGTSGGGGGVAKPPRLDGTPGQPLLMTGTLARFSQRAWEERPSDAAFVLHDGALHRVRAEGLTEAWAFGVHDREPTLLRASESLILVWEDADFRHPAVTAIEAGSGRIRWAKRDLSGLFSNAVEVAWRQGIGDGVPARIDPIIGERDLVLVRRDGSAVSLSLADGSVNWHAERALESVDAVQGDDRWIALAGQRRPNEATEAAVVVLDRRTGATRFEWQLGEGEEVQWVVLDLSRMFVGTRLGVLRVDLGERAALEWFAMSNAMGMSQQAILIGGVLVIQCASEAILGLDAWSGLPRRGAFELPASLTIPGKPGRAMEWIGGALAVCDFDRIRCFDETGALMGEDAVAQDRSYLGTMVGQDNLRVVSRPVSPIVPAVNRPNGVPCQIWNFSLSQGLRLIDAPIEVDFPMVPDRMVGVDGWLLLSGSDRLVAIPLGESEG